MTLTSVLAGRLGDSGGPTTHPLCRAARFALVACACLSLMAVLPGRLGLFVIVALGGGVVALVSTRCIMALGGAAAVVSALPMLRLARREAAR